MKDMLSTEALIERARELRDKLRQENRMQEYRAHVNITTDNGELLERITVLVFVGPNAEPWGAVKDAAADIRETIERRYETTED